MYPDLMEDMKSFTKLLLLVSPSNPHSSTLTRLLLAEGPASLSATVFSSLDRKVRVQSLAQHAIGEYHRRLSCFRLSMFIYPFILSFTASQERGSTSGD